MKCETLKRDPEDEITPQYGPTGSVRGVERWYDGVVCSLDQFFCAITPRSNGSNKHKFCSVDLTVFPPRSTGPTCTSRHQAIHVEELWGSLHFLLWPNFPEHCFNPFWLRRFLDKTHSMEWNVCWSLKMPWVKLFGYKWTNTNACHGLITSERFQFPRQLATIVRSFILRFPIFRWFSQL